MVVGEGGRTTLSDCVEDALLCAVENPAINTFHLLMPTGTTQLRGAPIDRRNGWSAAPVLQFFSIVINVAVYE